MLAYDLLHNRQSQTGTIGFGSFEQLKDIDAIRYTDSGVADLQDYLIIQLTSFESQRAAARHSLSGVLAKI